jgi:hypothetical protein
VPDWFHRRTPEQPKKTHRRAARAGRQRHCDEPQLGGGDQRPARWPGASRTTGC